MVVGQIGYLVPTSGDMMFRAKENEKCCEQYYIESSEDGTEPRTPLVSADPTCAVVNDEKVCSRCHGGMKKSFTEWVDYAVTSDPPQGLCVAGWLYVLEGISMKFNFCNLLIFSTYFKQLFKHFFLICRRLNLQ